DPQHGGLDAGEVRVAGADCGLGPQARQHGVAGGANRHTGPARRLTHPPPKPGAGSAAAALKTTARRAGDHYVLNGTKQFISGAGATDFYFVFARTGDDGAGGISAFVDMEGAAGFSVG